MIRIQVLGSGLIPRGHGIAPKKEPFPADLRLIGIILSTGGLKVNFVHPDSGKLVQLTRENYQDMYKKYANRVYKKPVEAEGNDQEKEGTGEPKATSPVAPVVPPVVPPVVETTPEVPVAKTAEPEQVAAPLPVVSLEKQDKPAEFSMKPITAPDEKATQAPQNNQRNQNNNQSNNQSNKPGYQK